MTPINANMRTILLLITFTGFVFYVNGQQINPENKKLYSYLVNKSKQQRKTGRYLLIGGGVFYTFGALISLNDGPAEGIAKAAPAILSVGSCGVVACIPFFISAGSNQNKAQQLLISVNLERNHHLDQINTSSKRFPALSLTIPIH
jgi:Ni,Fe-hydrogenase I small subunit